VVRRQAESLEERLQVYDGLAREVDLREPQQASAGGRATKGLGDLLCGFFGSKKVRLSISDWLQITFVMAIVLYALAFIGTLVFSLVTHA
jgi:hypothetical protein